MKVEPLLYDFKMENVTIALAFERMAENSEVFKILLQSSLDPLSIKFSVCAKLGA